VFKLFFVILMASRALSAISVSEYAEESEKKKISDFRLCVKDRMKQLRLYDHDLWKIVEPELLDESPTKPGIKPIIKFNGIVKFYIDAAARTNNTVYLKAPVELILDGVMLEMFPETKAFTREVRFKIHRPPKVLPKPRPHVI
jgi:hypothetical protein